MNATLLLCLETAAALALGLLLGFVHFRTLASVSEDYLAGNAARAVLMQALRMVVMVAVLFGLVRLGALPLLAGALGIVISRSIVLRRAGDKP